MRVIRYEAHNVLRVQDIKFDLEGRHLYLVGGKNSQGKTSALKAFLMAMCGRSGMDWPDVALRDGEDEGWVKIDLDASDSAIGSLTVEMLLKRRRNGQVVEQFRVTDAEGKDVPEPRTLLKRLYEVRGFDPLSFERMKKDERRDLLRKLLGLDCAEQEKQYKRIYTERTDVNRDAEKAKARIASMKKHGDAPEQEVAVADLVAELDRIRSTNDDNKKKREKEETLSKAVVAGKEEVERRKRLVNQALLAVQEAEKALSVQEQVLKTTADAHREQLEVIGTLVDLPEDDVRSRIASAETVNQKVRDNKARLDAEQSLGELEAKYKLLDNQLADIKAAQQKALQEAKWPVDGLSLDAEGVLYNGLPFEQASKSVRVLTSVKIGMALNPRLRVLVCQDGNDLDSDSMAALQKTLEENDFQMIVEMVTRTSADEDLCAVVVEDGKARRASA